MKKRKGLILTAVAIAALIGWQIWEEEQPVVKVTEAAAVRFSGATPISAPPAESESDPLPVIDLTKAFTIVPPDSGLTASESVPTIEQLPTPRPAMEDAAPAVAPTVIPASFVPHAAETTEPMAVIPLWKRLASFLLGGSFLRSREPAAVSEPSKHFRPGYLPPDPDFPLSRELAIPLLEAELRRMKEMYPPHTHSGCPYQGGCSYGAAGHRTAKPDSAPWPASSPAPKIAPPAPADVHKLPKIDTMEVRPGDLPRAWHVRPF